MLESMNRITETFRLGNKIMKFNNHPSTANPPLTHVPKCCIPMASRSLWGWWPHHCLGQPLLMPGQQFHDKFSLISNLNLPQCNLRLFPAVLSLFLGAEPNHHLGACSFQGIVEGEGPPWSSFSQGWAPQPPQPPLLPCPPSDKHITGLCPLGALLTHRARAGK